MAKDDIYDIMPHKEVAELKRQMQELKSGKNSNPELVQSMTALSGSMDAMLRLFTEAAEELKLEGKEESELQEKLGPMNRKLNEVIDQNKTIAEGIVAISDMIKDFMEHNGAGSKQDFQQRPDPFPQKAFDNQFSDIPGPAPMPSPTSMPPSSDFPPMDRHDDKKRGIFGRIKR